MSDNPTDNDILVGEMNTTFAALPTEENAPEPPPSQPAAPTSDRKTAGCLRNVLLTLLSAILGAVLALAILLSINGSLHLNQEEKANFVILRQENMQAEQTQLEQQIQEQQQRVATLEARAQALNETLEQYSQSLDDLQARTGLLEQEHTKTSRQLETMQTTQTTINQQVGEMTTTLETVQKEMRDFAKTAERFDTFVAGLINLVSQVSADVTPAPPTATSEPARTPAPTATPTHNAPTATPEPAHSDNSAALTRFPPRRPLPTPAAGRSIIFGLIWHDANGNQQPDANETVLPGTRVTLKDAHGETLLSMITGQDGRFAFINMPPNDYQIEIIDADDTFELPPMRQVRTRANQSNEINFGLTQ